MHKILLRQIDRYLGDVSDATAKQKEFMEVVSKTYTDFEKEYALMERSLNISSKELQEVNEKIRREIDKEHKRTEELERFNKLMVDRELKMVALKKKIVELEN